MESKENNSPVAVIALGGTQFVVRQGSKIKVNRLENKPNEQLKITSLISDEPVELKVIEHGKGKKIRGLKFKNKVRYIRHYGHRQLLTTLEVISIGAKKAEKPATTPKAKAEPKTSVKKTTKKEKND